MFLSRIITKLPLHFIFIAPFVLQIFGTVGLVGYLSFRNGQKAVEELAYHLMNEIGYRIEQNLDSYINILEQVVQNNASLLEQNILDSQDLPALETVLWQQIHIFRQLSAVMITNDKKNLERWKGLMMVQLF